MATKLSWEFPLKEFFLLKIEALFIAHVAVIIFLVSFFGNNNQLFPALVLSLGFVLLYFTLAYVIQQLRKPQEKYDVSDTHIHITRKTAKKVQKEKVPLKDIIHHKLDNFFLGGYVLTSKGKKHVLFFNSRIDVGKFARHLKKHAGARS